MGGMLSQHSTHLADAPRVGDPGFLLCMCSGVGRDSGRCGVRGSVALVVHTEAQSWGSRARVAMLY